MPKSVLLVWGGWLQIALSVSASGAFAAPTVGLDRSRYMGVDQIKPGMTGMGRTVLKGNNLIEFKVTVVEVLRKWGPQQSAILVRCAEAGLEHTGIIAGMSGSPVYLHDPQDAGKLKMVGAIAFGWLWNKDPVGGVQPIEQMLSLGGLNAPATPTADAGGGGAATGSGIVPGDAAPTDRTAPPSRYTLVGFDPPVRRYAAPRAERAGAPNGLEAIRTPLVVSGSNRAVMDYLERHLDGTTLMPVQGGAGGSTSSAPDTFVPGGPLVVPFLVGDMDMSAVGTVTEVIGNRVIGFGHSMMGEGPVELPMATGSINTVIALMPRSFKLGAMGKIIGTLVRDEETGIWGFSDRPARMIPLQVTVQEPEGTRSYAYRALHHHAMTPWVVGMGLFASVTAHRDLPEEHTVKYRFTVDYQKVGRFAVENVSSMSGLWEVQSDLTEPISLMMNSSFGKAKVDRVEMNLSIEPKSSVAQMDRVEITRSLYRPGETIDVAVRWRPYRADAFVRHYAIAIPSELPDGTYNLTVGSSRSQLMGWRSEKPHLFKPESIADVLAATQRLSTIRNDRVYLRLDVHRGGLAVGRQEMPELPAFRRQIFDEAKLQAAQPYSEPLVVEHAVPFVVGGEQRFTIQVSRKADS